MSDADEPPIVYVVEMTNGFFADLDDGWEHFRFHASEAIADEWRESIIRAVWQIVDNPLGYPLPLEHAHFKHPVRRLLHQRTKTSATYRVLFCLEEPVAREDGTQATSVVVFAAIHASARPLSARKVRALERRN